MGLKKTEAEKKAAAEQRKKNRQGLAKFAGKVWKGVKYHVTTPYAQVKRDQAQKKEDLKIKEKVKKDTKSPAAKAGLSVEQRAAAAKRTATFKADRKVKDKGQKSYNKGRDKKDHVGSAYERRQADAKKEMQDSAKKRHEAWLKKNKRGKYSDRAIAKAKKKTIEKQTGSKAGKVKGSNKYDFTTM